MLRQHGSLEDQQYKLINFFPKDAHAEDPDHTPDKVLTPYSQAVANLASENWDAAGTMARKTLEISTRDVARNRIDDEKESQKTVKLWLKMRIEKLGELGVLTKDLADVAKIIKDGGDEAVHDDEPYTEEQAKKIIEFCRAFLIYVYTIPRMIELIKHPDVKGEPDTTSE